MECIGELGNRNNIKKEKEQEKIGKRGHDFIGNYEKYNGERALIIRWKSPLIIRENESSCGRENARGKGQEWDK